MEDAATAEICRAQLWQWIQHGSETTDKRIITEELCLKMIGEELQKLRTLLGDTRYESGHFGLASSLFEDLITDEKFPEFLTLGAYDELLSLEETVKV